MKTIASACLLLLVAGLAAADPDPRLEAMRAAARTARTVPYVPLSVPVPHAGGGFALTGATLAYPADAGSVPRYGRVELTVAVTGLTSTKPYEPDPARGGVDLRATFTAPSGAIWSIPGYFDGTGWRIRFAPGETGTWSCDLSMADTGSSVSTLTGPAFICVASAGHGWVHESDGSLVHADGSRFFAVGHNNGWQPDVEQPSFTSMVDKGERLLSFWLYQPWGAGAALRAPIEQVQGPDWIYNQSACGYIDGVIQRAEAAGCFVLPSIWAHDELRDASHPWGAGNWTNSAYATICGTNTAENFFATGAGGSEQWIRQRAYLRYLTARWGYSQAVIGWVGVVELEGTTGWTKAQAEVLTWCQSVRQWFVDNDPYRSAAGTYPVSFSNQSNAGITWQHDNSPADLRGYDSYAKQSDDILVGQQLAAETLYLGAAVPARPVLHTEFGGDVVTPDATSHLTASQPAHLHNGVWADLAAGAAVPALLWCDDGHFPMLTTGATGAAMRDHLQWLAAFTANIAWLGDADLASAGTLEPADSVFKVTRSKADRGFAWFQSQAVGGIIAPGRVCGVPVSTAGEYEVWWYDTWSGSEEPPVDVVSDVASLALVAPVLAVDRPDLAVSWQLRPATPGPATWEVRFGRTRTVTLPAGRITSLPAIGSLYQTSDGVTRGAPISSVPADVSDPGRRVIYQAPNNGSTASFTIVDVDGRAESHPGTVTMALTIDPIPGVDEGPVSVRFDTGSGCGSGAAGLALILPLIGLLRLRGQRRPD